MFSRLLILTAFLATSIFAFADTNATPSGGQNDYPPGSPVPQSSHLPPDDTIFELTPAADYSVHVGYSGWGDNKGFDSGVGIGALVFLDGGRTGVILEAQANGGQNSAFASFKA